MHTIHFDHETEQRLSLLAAKGGKQPEDLIKEAVSEYLQDIEDYYDAEATLQRIATGEERIWTLEETERDLGLGR
jgi:RHH-type rel operon transcriptional repressor/antitoxin RelB